MVARASTASSHPYLEQRCCFRLSARLLAPGRPAELLSILLHDRGRRLRRMPTPPRSSIKVHSAAIRRTTSSAVNTGGILRATPGGMFASKAILGVKRFSTASVHFRRVIPEIDIWRAANLMLKRYGEKALEESATRADELATDGDHDGAVTWRRITAAVGQLANTTPPGPVH
jgi:hypothetical protein